MQGTERTCVEEHIPINEVNAATTILTGLGGTFVDLRLTVGPCQAWKTLARVAIVSVHARPVVHTRVRLTLLDVDLASRTYAHTRQHLIFNTLLY